MEEDHAYGWHAEILRTGPDPDPDNMAVKKIIVHGGKAHLDDVFACALAMARKGNKTPEDKIPESLADLRGPVPIERRDPSSDEISDEEILVMDVGMQYVPSMAVFDHHHFNKDIVTSAMALLAANIRTPPGEHFYYTLLRLFPWWETAVRIDQNGPYAAAMDKGLDWGKDVSPFIGPLAEAYLRMFEDAATPEARGELVYSTLTRMVDEKVEAYANISGNLVETVMDGVKILDFTRCNPRTCEAASGVFTALAGSGVAIFITRPRRDGETWESTGLTLMRINDDQRIDFTRIRGDEGVQFVHSGGFLCTTVGRDIEVAKSMIARAATP